MLIQIYNRTNQNIFSYRPLFEQISESCEKVLKLPKDLEISITFVRSRTIHQINKDYRNIDRPTDVISFAIQDDETCNYAREDLGDIFINIDYAKRQAKEYRHSYKREIAFLFTHGLLHCLGYDHIYEEDEKVMIDLQKKILDNIVKK